MKSKKRKKYTKEFKEEAVKLITDQGYSFIGNKSPQKWELLWEKENAA